MTSKGRVLILSHDEDPHLPKVTRFLSEEPLCINTGAIPTRGLSYDFDSGSPWPEVSYGDQSLNLHSRPVRSVWYRSIDPRRLITDEEMAHYVDSTLSTSHTIADHYRLFDAIIGEPSSEYCEHVMPGPTIIHEYVASSLNRLASALPDVIPNAFWVSRREPLIAASSKVRQRIVARQVGFTTLPAIFTSEVKAAEAFLAKFKACVVKPLAIRPPRRFNQQTRTMVYGQKVPAGLNWNPHIFEQLVVPDFELRVMVVGHQTFASRVWNSSEVIRKDFEGGEVRDMRAGFGTGTFCAEAYELPAEVHAMCVALTERLGLASGMIDLLVKDGKFYFLEDNGNGQWAFVDDDTVEQIGRAMATMLERGAV